MRRLFRWSLYAVGIVVALNMFASFAETHYPEEIAAYRAQREAAAAERAVAQAAAPAAHVRGGRLPSTKAGIAARQIDNQYEDCRRRNAGFYGAETATVCRQVMLDSPDFTPGAKQLWREWKF